MFWAHHKTHFIQTQHIWNKTLKNSHAQSPLVYLLPTPDSLSLSRLQASPAPACHVLSPRRVTVPIRVAVNHLCMSNWHLLVSEFMLTLRPMSSCVHCEAAEPGWAEPCVCSARFWGNCKILTYMLCVLIQPNAALIQSWSANRAT